MDFKEWFEMEVGIPLHMVEQTEPDKIKLLQAAFQAGQKQLVNSKFTNEELAELESYCKAHETLQPTARLTKLLRLALEEILSLREKTKE